MCHVLIIEDEMLVAMDLQSLLSGAGATSFAFASTELEAVEQALERLPHVMTSDVRLSVGTGPEAVATIRERLGHIPVIFISGTPADCPAVAAGDVVFGKPFDRSCIAAAFRTMVDGASDPGRTRPSS